MPELFKNRLSGTQLKYIAMLCMLADHLGAGILSPLIRQGYTDLIPWYDTMRSVGRLAFPLYCLLAAEGVKRTRHKLRYILGLWFFAAISEIPFDMTAMGVLYDQENQNVYFTLAAAVTVYFISRKIHGMWKFIPYIIAAVFAHVIKSDYGAFGILMLCLYFSGVNTIQYMAGSAEIIKGLCALFKNSWLQVPSIPTTVGAYMLLLGSYNGKRGISRMKNKYVFYAFYPIHLLLIGVVRMYLLHG